MLDCLSHCAPLKKNESVLNEIVGEIEEYFTHYDYVANQSGYMVAIYKNNGEVHWGNIKDTDAKRHREIYRNVEVNKNLLTMAYIKEKDLDENNEEIGASIAAATSVGTGAFLDPVVVKTLKAGGLNKLAGCVKSIQDIINSLRAGGLIGYYTYDALSKKLLKDGISDEISRLSAETNKLCAEAKLNDGLSPQTREWVDRISFLSSFVSMNIVGSVVAGVVLGPVAEWKANQISKYQGDFEIKRFQDMVKDGTVIDKTKMNPPESGEIIYQNETGLQFITPDGAKFNKIHAGNDANYIHLLERVYAILYKA